MLFGSDCAGGGPLSCRAAHSRGTKITRQRCAGALLSVVYKLRGHRMKLTTRTLAATVAASILTGCATRPVAVPMSEAPVAAVPLAAAPLQAPPVAEAAVPVPPSGFAPQPLVVPAVYRPPQPVPQVGAATWQPKWSRESERLAAFMGCSVPIARLTLAEPDFERYAIRCGGDGGEETVRVNCEKGRCSSAAR